ncbi:HRDC domain-containing protein [bacterium]|nr:HRDC domain-containing protein [bacterium]
MSKYDNLDEYQNNQIEELRKRVAKLEEQVSSLMMQSLSPKQKAPVSQPAEAKAKQEEELTQEEQKLYDALKDWRFARAKAMDKPAYVICNNQLLTAISKTKPRTTEELDELPGAGDKFMESYAWEVLEIIRRM